MATLDELLALWNEVSVEGLQVTAIDVVPRILRVNAHGEPYEVRGRAKLFLKTGVTMYVPFEGAPEDYLEMIEFVAGYLRRQLDPDVRFRRGLARAFTEYVDRMMLSD